MARSYVAMAARVNGVTAVDQIVAAFNDLELFAVDAALGRSLGYQGKLCIHPPQVAPANDAFAPSSFELERAALITELYDAASESGVGSVSFEGQMIDVPLARQARNIVEAIT